MGCLTQDYWTRESKNGTVIKRHCEIPLRDEKRMKADPNFYKMITPDKIIKKKKTSNQRFRVIVLSYKKVNQNKIVVFYSEKNEVDRANLLHLRENR